MSSRFSRQTYNYSDRQQFSDRSARLARMTDREQQEKAGAEAQERMAKKIEKLMEDSLSRKISDQLINSIATSGPPITTTSITTMPFTSWGTTTVSSNSTPPMVKLSLPYAERLKIFTANWART